MTWSLGIFYAMKLGFLDSSWFPWLGGMSLAMFIITLVALPLVVAYLPENYFVRSRRTSKQISIWNLLWLVAKNVLGVVLLIAGIAMLALPGQGLLTILVGIMLMNFPGKRQMERWLVSRPRVASSLNWLRGKFRRPPLQLRHDATVTKQDES